MIIFRHHRGLLEDSMKTVREFQSFEELQDYIIEYMKPYGNLVREDIVARGVPCIDERTGWQDTDMVCIREYENVSDKKWYKFYFSGEYDCPQCIGYFATRYPKHT